MRSSTHLQLLGRLLMCETQTTFTVARIRNGNKSALEERSA